MARIREKIGEWLYAALTGDSYTGNSNQKVTLGQGVKTTSGELDTAIERHIKQNAIDAAWRIAKREGKSPLEAVRIAEQLREGNGQYWVQEMYTAQTAPKTWQREILAEYRASLSPSSTVSASTVQPSITATTPVTKKSFLSVPSAQVVGSTAARTLGVAGVVATATQGGLEGYTAAQNAKADGKADPGNAGWAAFSGSIMNAATSILDAKKRSINPITGKMQVDYTLNDAVGTATTKILTREKAPDLKGHKNLYKVAKKLGVEGNFELMNMTALSQFSWKLNARIAQLTALRESSWPLTTRRWNSIAALEEANAARAELKSFMDERLQKEASASEQRAKDMAAQEQGKNPGVAATAMQPSGAVPHGSAKLVPTMSASSRDSKTR